MIRLRKNYVNIAAIAGLVLAFAAASLGKTHSNPAFSNIKISNFGQMDERFYRGARPSERDFESLKALGIRTVIDLTDNTPQEKGYVEAQGMRYVNIAIPDKQDPSDAQIQQFLKLANDPTSDKFLVHDAGGQELTGVMAWVERVN